MDVLVLVADGIIFGDLDYGARISQRLRAAGLSVGLHDLTEAGPLPSARAYVLTGGETSVHSAEPWMRSAIDNVRELALRADETGVPVVGVCLGSQILAEALRPDSIISTDAIEIGFTPVFNPDKRDAQVVPSFHYQAIAPEIDAVEGARLEWRNAHTPVQAFSYGKNVFGCQYHPELTADDMHVLIDTHAELITEYSGDVAAAHRSVEDHAASFSPDLFQRTVIDRVIR